MKTQNNYSIIFGEKKIETKILDKQSNLNYLLLKDNDKLYYIHKIKTKQTVLIGDNDDAEHFILYTLNEFNNEVKDYFKK